MAPQSNPDSASLMLTNYLVGTVQLGKTSPPDVALRNAITLTEAGVAVRATDRRHRKPGGPDPGA